MAGNDDGQWTGPVFIHQGPGAIGNRPAYGMEVADAIVSAPTDPAKGRESPALAVQITRCEVSIGVAGLSDEEQAAYHTMLQDLADGGSTW